VVSDERDVGTISRAALAAMLPENLTLRMGKNGKVYIVSPWCAWYMHNQGGQDALRQAGTFYQDSQPGEPAKSQESAPAPAREPAAPASESQEPRKKRGVFDFFGELGELD